MLWRISTIFVYTVGIMHMTHPSHSRYFRAFLVLYVAVLAYHAYTVQWHPLLVAGFALGLILALIAHVRGGALTIFLLLVHMTIEWTEHATRGAHYGTGEIVFQAIHAVLDIAFLWQEMSCHLRRYRAALLGIVAVGMGTALVIAHWHFLHDPASAVLNQVQGTGILETIVLGGILGCTLSHIGIKKKHQH